MQPCQHPTFRRSRSFSEINRHEGSKRTQTSSLDDSNHDEHSYVYASSSQCAPHDRDGGCGDETQSTTDLVCQWTSAESSDASSEEEKGIHSAKNVVCVFCSWSGLREVEVGEEAWLADGRSEGCKAWFIC